jgi:hypothetical protein
MIQGMPYCKIVELRYPRNERPLGSTLAGIWFANCIDASLGGLRLFFLANLRIGDFARAVGKVRGSFDHGSLEGRQSECQPLRRAKAKAAGAVVSSFTAGSAVVFSRLPARSRRTRLPPLQPLRVRDISFGDYFVRPATPRPRNSCPATAGKRLSIWPAGQVRFREAGQIRPSESKLHS